MIYIYPKFTKYEIPGVRFGGAGLGNLLFLWARAIVAAEQHHAELIWPTWPSVKAGTWIRHEADKRFYGDLFRNHTRMTGGIRKYWILGTHPRHHCRKYEQADWDHLKDGDVIVGEGYDMGTGKFQMNFDGLREYRSLIAGTIEKNLAAKGRKALAFEASKAVNVHVRLGDFSRNPQGLAQGKNNMRIRTDWYAAMVLKIRDAAGWQVPINVFSDGTDDELKELLCLPGVQRVFFGNSIADIIALSKTPVMIASGSSFSLWARFLGNCSSISYPAQMKDRVLQNGTGFEIELSEEQELPEDVSEQIRQSYRR